jgi:hypothetical protein
MENNSTQATNGTASDNDGSPVRRRGDRRVAEQAAVPEDRRKGDRRDLPGLSALFRTLFRHGKKTES